MGDWGSYSAWKYNTPSAPTTRHLFRGNLLWRRLPLLVFMQSATRRTLSDALRRVFSRWILVQESKKVGRLV